VAVRTCGDGREEGGCGRNASTMASGSREGGRPLSRFPLRGKAGAGGFPPRRQNQAAPPTRGVSKRSAETPLVDPPSLGRACTPTAWLSIQIAMEDRELYRRILGIESPWSVTSVDLQLTPKEVHIYLDHDDLPTWPCAECAAPSKLYDHQPERQWRHLDTCQYRTILQAEPPRSQCPTHGVRVVKLPWAEPASRFTALFEALAIAWLKAASKKAVGEPVLSYLRGMTGDDMEGLSPRKALRRESASFTIRYLSRNVTVFAARSTVSTSHRRRRFQGLRRGLAVVLDEGRTVWESCCARCSRPASSSESVMPNARANMLNT
jgi:hypothetical protein